MTRPQPGILDPVPTHSRYLSFRLAPDAAPGAVLQELARRPLDGSLVVGLGPSLVAALGAEVPGLRALPVHSGAGFDVPSTPAALWCWLRGDDRGELLGASRNLEASLAPAFLFEDRTDAFRFREGRDLSGYEDGTENPTGEEAEAAALLQGAGPGFDGGSLVAVQRWVHELERLEAMPQGARDHVIGRRLADNEELEDAPESAHVKRTAQESFDPPAFMLRRSLPWADARGEGLVFVAFGHSLDAFERQLRRMVGAEDGVADGLFRFTRPVTGASYFCPPQRDGRLDLRAVGL